MRARSRPRAFKMKDLERASGVGRETIRFYIREGLLPEPERPGRNVAWYDPSFVERLALIKELQRKRFLPLHAIKAIVGGSESAADWLHMIAELVRTLEPAIVRLGVATPAEVDVESLADRLRREVAAGGGIVVGRSEIGAWSRV